MTKLLDFLNEMDDIQDQVEQLTREKEDLEKEILSRGEEVYQLNEKALLIELQTKMFIEDEVKCLKDLHIRTENSYFVNQKCLVESNKFKSLIETVKCEIEILIKKNNLKSILKNEDSVEYTEQNKINELIQIKTFEEMNKNLIYTLDILSEMENMITSNSKELADMSDLLLSKNSFTEYPELIKNANKNRPHSTM